MIRKNERVVSAASGQRQSITAFKEGVLCPRFLPRAASTGTKEDAPDKSPSSAIGSRLSVD